MESDSNDITPVQGLTVMRKLPLTVLLRAIDMKLTLPF